MSRLVWPCSMRMMRHYHVSRFHIFLSNRMGHLWKCYKGWFRTPSKCSKTLWYVACGKGNIDAARIHGAAVIGHPLHWHLTLNTASHVFVFWQWRSSRYFRCIGASISMTSSASMNLSSSTTVMRARLAVSRCVRATSSCWYTPYITKCVGTAEWSSFWNFLETSTTYLFSYLKQVLEPASVRADSKYVPDRIMRFTGDANVHDPVRTAQWLFSAYLVADVA